MLKLAQTDQQTNRQTGQKQYVPHYYSGGHKNNKGFVVAAIQPAVAAEMGILERLAASQKTDERTNRRTEEGTNERTDERIDKRTDAWMNEGIVNSTAQNSQETRSVETSDCRTNNQKLSLNSVQDKRIDGRTNELTDGRTK
ncbi:hypothetical protein DPMN_099020 [Dreissena polymorpha]|uniref:Uncharacterized protein n=1 Tax=Dreissena polymorpha TaxID=45954 RepID=A0A9D4LD63_DREPO|nr:hypothetical protein DPMN_099020 [Dreissena polymorpha]